MAALLVASSASTAPREPIPMADVRVGIVSWNTAALLDRCLAALPEALAGLDAEVVVVDNASADDSAERAGRHAHVRLVRNDDNTGYARAMNQALAGSTAPVLIALNPDTDPPPGSLRALVELVLAQPQRGLVVPRLTNADGSVQYTVQRFPSVALAWRAGFVPARFQRGALGRRWCLPGAPPPDAPAAIDWAIGAVHVIRRDALAGRAPYSERWFMYVEDIEICWWLHEHGWEVWSDPTITVPHVGNAAGEQAWGSSRAPRFWAASYDFVGLTRGQRYARLWALVNTVAVALHVVVRRVAARLLPRRRAALLATAAELRGVLPVHRRALLEGAEAVGRDTLAGAPR
jgi:GT2 family glycosyltransferase